MYKFICGLMLILAAGFLFIGPALAAPKGSAKIIPTQQEQTDKAASTAEEQKAAEAEKAVQEKTAPAVKEAVKEAKAPVKAEAEAKPAATKTQTKAEAKPEPKKVAKAEPKPEPKKTPAKKSEGPLGLSGALSGSSQEPIKIISNRLVADDKSGTVIFTGKVKAVQGETTLYCDQLTVHYAKIKTEGGSEQDAQRELTRIVTEGHVKVVLPGQTAYGQKGIYQIAEGLIVLQGRPKIVRGGNTLTGDKIVVYLNENKAVVEGGRQMVEAVIVPQSLNEPKPKQTAGADAGVGPASGIGTVSAGNN